MYVRFTILAFNPDSKEKAGVLVTAATLRDEGELSVEEHRDLRLSLAWFNKNLNVPACLAEPRNKRALSWFKPEAIKPMQQMWRLKGILDQHGFHVEVMTSANPGRILYEDGWQIVAIPKRGQRLTRKHGAKRSEAKARSRET